MSTSYAPTATAEATHLTGEELTMIARMTHDDDIDARVRLAKVILSNPRAHVGHVHALMEAGQALRVYRAADFDASSDAFSVALRMLVHAGAPYSPLAVSRWKWNR